MKAKTSCIIVLISDTQDAHLYIGSLSDGDVLIHAGDFTRRRPPARNEKEYRRFIDSHIRTRSSSKTSTWLMSSSVSSSMGYFHDS